MMLVGGSKTFLSDQAKTFCKSTLLQIINSSPALLLSSFTVFLLLCNFNDLQQCLMCLQVHSAYREGVKLLDFSVNRLQQGEVAGDATLSHSEKCIVIIQEEMELGILSL